MEFNSDRYPLERLAEMGRRYAVFLADPPYEFTTYSDKAQKSAKNHYATMTPEQIATLPVYPLAMQSCSLCLWGTSPNLPDMLVIMRAWKFRYTTKLFNWVKITRHGKEFIGLGYYTRANPEDCWLGIRIDSEPEGKPPVVTPPDRLSHSVRQLLNSPAADVLSAEIGPHSRKPDEIYTRIMDLFPGPYLELFARPNPNRPPLWDSWGNEL